MSLFINCGSGQRPFEKPWTNVDIQEKWKPDVVADWRDMPMFEDESAEIIVAHHTIEHVGCGEAKPFFLEACRILQPGGSLIITVPDLRTLAQRWMTGQIDDYLYFVNLMGAYNGDEADIHRWHYSFESLSTELAECRLNAKRFDWRDIPGSSIARDWWVLGVEAVK